MLNLELSMPDSYERLQALATRIIWPPEAEEWRDQALERIKELEDHLRHCLTDTDDPFTSLWLAPATRF